MLQKLLESGLNGIKILHIRSVLLRPHSHQSADSKVTYHAKIQLLNYWDYAPVINYHSRANMSHCHHRLHQSVLAFCVNIPQFQRPEMHNISVISEGHISWANNDNQSGSVFNKR